MFLSLSCLGKSLRSKLQFNKFPFKIDIFLACINDDGILPDIRLSLIEYFDIVVTLKYINGIVKLLLKLLLISIITSLISSSKTLFIGGGKISTSICESNGNDKLKA